MAIKTEVKLQGNDKINAELFKNFDNYYRKIMDNIIK